MTMKNVHVIQLEHQGIPEEPHLFTDKAEAQASYEELLKEETSFRERTEDETYEEYNIAYWDFLQNDGSEEKNTIRWWVLDVKDSEAPAHPDILQASKSALKVLESITNKLYVPDRHSRAMLDEGEIALIFIEVIQGAVELEAAIKKGE